MTLLVDPPAGAVAAEHEPGREARLARAGAAGLELAELVGAPPGFAVRAHADFADLAEREYRIGQKRVAPGIGPTHGVRLPYQAALRRALTKDTRHDSPANLLLVADRLLREPELEAR